MKNQASQKTSSSRVRFEFVISLFLILAILVVYYQTKNYDFVLLDDDVYITHNPFVAGGWSSENIKWAFSNSHGGFWIPLTWLTYIIDSQLHGLNAGYYHITNLIFHILNSLLLFFIFRQMTGDIWQSGFIAALFAVHPVHVESVAWVSERKDLLFAFFWLLTMWSYLHYVKRPSTRRYSLVILLFVAGLMSKPMIVTLPFVLLLCDYWPLKRFQLKKYPQADAIYPKISVPKMILEKVPLIILSIGASVLTFLQQQAHGAVSSLENSPINLRMANVLVSYVKYLAKMVWPHDLTAIYPFPPSIPFWHVAGACLLLAFIFLLAIKHFTRRPYLAIGWLWFVGTLVPVIGIIKIGSHAMADRYTYMPFIGLYIVIAWGVPEILSQFRYKKVVLVSAAVALIAGLMLTAKIQTSYWANSIRLFTHAIEVTQDNFLAHRNLGLALSYRGELDKAFWHFKQALRINPKSARSYNDIGTYLMLKGKYDDSIGYFKKALFFQPNFSKAHNNIGLVLMAKKNYAEAIGHFQKALRADPNFASARQNLQKANLSLKNSQSHM
jgi:tetratricopeptide (TPR) repeat protein